MRTLSVSREQRQRRVSGLDYRPYPLASRTEPPTIVSGFYFSSAIIGSIDRAPNAPGAVAQPNSAASIFRDVVLTLRLPHHAAHAIPHFLEILPVLHQVFVLRDRSHGRGLQCRIPIRN